MHHCFTVSRFSSLFIKKKNRPVIPVVHNQFPIIIRIISAKFDRNWSGDFRKKIQNVKSFKTDKHT